MTDAPLNTTPNAANGPPSLAVLGVDTGSRWTAGCLRFGDQAIYGWTLGPRDELGNRNVKALDKWDDLAAVRRYCLRIGEKIEHTLDIAEKRGIERIRIAVEATVVPVGYIDGRKTRISLVDWLVPREVLIALLVMYPDARIVAPDHHGQRPSAEYPPALRGRRPADWGSNENPKGERDHEQAAYDVAGIGALLP